MNIYWVRRLVGCLQWEHSRVGTIDPMQMHKRKTCFTVRQTKQISKGLQQAVNNLMLWISNNCIEPRATQRSHACSTDMSSLSASQRIYARVWEFQKFLKNSKLLRTIGSHVILGLKTSTFTCKQMAQALKANYICQSVLYRCAILVLV